jgi:hypothetical protein
MTKEFLGTSPVTENPDLKFSSLEDEQHRTYEYSDGYKITILNPYRLNVSKSGGHRVLDKQGVSHYIAPGWKHLSWVVKDGQPYFAF